MTKAEQKHFSVTLIDSIRGEILNKLPGVPQAWNGIELRKYIADKFSECAFPELLQGKRLKDYRNVIATTTL